MPDMRVRIVGVSATVTQIRLERVSRVPGMKDGVQGRRICDYALLEESDDRIYAVLIELKTTRNREDDRPKEQLRRSLPILEYLRSACDVERGTAATRTMSVGYVIVFERENAQAPDKQRVRPNDSATERYENITISTFVGNTIPFPWLMATLPAA